KLNYYYKSNSYKDPEERKKNEQEILHLTDGISIINNYLTEKSLENIIIKILRKEFEKMFPWYFAKLESNLVDILPEEFFQKGTKSDELYHLVNKIQNDLETFRLESQEDHKQIKKEVERSIQEPIRSEFYKTNYWVSILSKSKGGNGVLIIKDDNTGENHKIQVTGIQLKIMIGFALNIKEDKEKNLHPPDQGWMDYDVIKKAVGWTIKTDPAQVRNEIKRMRKYLRDENLNENLIETQKNIGYRISTHPDNILLFPCPDAS
ncbi:MAG: hypothetical protein QG646_125, partial [Euryarchaeota archaeon]|nr:hypothetical protein [Euryarchaeota archaeon]